MDIKVTSINKGKTVTTTGFGSYDYCANPYVGCQFGCTYCYVRFFVTDKDREWGDFVRTKDHIHRLFEKHMKPVAGKRLVIGTMVDPYQPIERKKRLTRAMLAIIAQMEDKPSEIGLFTRSPIALEDIDLFKKLNVRIHVTITPFKRDVLTKIEPIAITTEARFKMVEELVAAGIKVHISVSPVMPIYSDPYIQPFADRIAQIKPDGFTIDPMQAYGAAFEATNEALQGDTEWPDVATIIRDNQTYKKWKKGHQEAWEEAWAPHKDLPVLAISMDHQGKKRKNLSTGEEIDFKEFSYA